MKIKTPLHYPRARQRERGISLFIVLVLVLLGMLLALWASRTALLNEYVTSNDADYQRTYAAAQAMLQDAKLDIRRQRPDGSSCAFNPAVPPKCGRFATPLRFPDQAQEVMPLLTALNNATGTANCSVGICLMRTGVQDFWNVPAQLVLMQAPRVGARYGEHTGAGIPTDAGAGTVVGIPPKQDSNPILNERNNNSQGAWYWVEVMQYAANGPVIDPTLTSTLLPINLDPQVIYRITAIAYGRKAGTRVVLQENFAVPTFSGSGPSAGGPLLTPGGSGP